MDVMFNARTKAYLIIRLIWRSMMQPTLYIGPPLKNEL